MQNSFSLAAGQPVTMSSLELLDLINQARASCDESEVRRNQFHDRIRDELDGDHYQNFVVENSNGTESIAFQLTHDQCMLVAMRESKAVRRSVLEKLNGKKPAELSRMDILRIAMESEQARIEAESKLAIAAPKAEFVDKYVTADTGSLGLRQVCKLLNAKQNEFTAFLLDRRFMYRTTPNSPLQPRADHMHSGRFEAKTGVAEHAESSHAFVHYKFTAKGFEWIAAEWAKHKAREMIEYNNHKG